MAGLLSKPQAKKIARFLLAESFGLANLYLLPAQLLLPGSIKKLSGITKEFFREIKKIHEKTLFYFKLIIKAGRLFQLMAIKANARMYAEYEQHRSCGQENIAPAHRRSSTIQIYTEQ